MPIESLPNQRQLPFSDTEEAAHPSKLLKGWDKINAMSEVQAKCWLVVAVSLLFSEDADDDVKEAEKAAEACAWRSEILPGRWRRKLVCL